MEISQSLMDRLAENGWAYDDQLISKQQLTQWRELALVSQKAGAFRPAAVVDKVQTQIRSDSILWLDPKHESLKDIFTSLESWRTQLTRGLTLSAPLIEAHWAHYSRGQSYQKHCDQPQGKKSRVLTFVVYLHAEWEPKLGGELAIYSGPTGPLVQSLAPQPGRVVFFKSDEVWHQVQESNFERLSLTGWFRQA